MSFLKKIWIKSRYNVVLFDGVKILGRMPQFKTPRNGKIVLHKNVVLNSDMKNSNTSLSYPCKLSVGYDGEIEVGENSMINGSCIVAYEGVKIGKNCQIASLTMITDTDFHPIDPSIRKAQVEGKSISFDAVAKDKIVIGNNVWIGWNSTILKGVIIGDNSIVGANSLVLKGCYPENVVLAGNPAKVVKYIGDEFEKL